MDQRLPDQKAAMPVRFRPWGRAIIAAQHEPLMKSPEPRGALVERQGEDLSWPSEAEKEAAMSLVEDMFKGGNVGTGIVAVLGAAVVAPVVLPVVRTLAKTVIKAGLVAYDQGRAMVDD